MSEDYRAAAERIVNATNLADDDLSSFEADVRTVALGYLDQAARIAVLEALVADALPVIEEDWSGVGFGNGVDWLRRARAALAPDEAGRSNSDA